MFKNLLIFSIMGYFCSCAMMGAPNFADCNYDSACLEAYHNSIKNDKTETKPVVNKKDEKTEKPVYNTIHVAILETVAHGSAQNNISLQERQYITDILRSEAVKILPPEKKYIIMTRDNIIAMLPPDRPLEECEGECIIETGRNISTEYIGQAKISNFGSKLTMTFELYDTKDGKLIKSITGEANTIDNLLVFIKKNSKHVFKKVI